MGGSALQDSTHLPVSRVQWGAVSPGKATVTGAHGNARHRCGAQRILPDPHQRQGWRTKRERMETVKSEGGLRPARSDRVPTSMPLPQGEAAHCFTRAARPGRKMATRHSPITPPPSPPPSACRAVRCHRRFPATRRQGPTRRHRIPTRP